MATIWRHNNYDNNNAFMPQDLSTTIQSLDDSIACGQFDNTTTQTDTFAAV